MKKNSIYFFSFYFVCNFLYDIYFYIYSYFYMLIINIIYSDLVVEICFLEFFFMTKLATCLHFDTKVLHIFPICQQKRLFFNY